MDEEFLKRARAGELRSVDLTRIGIPLVHCNGPRVIPRLEELGWYVLNETKTIAGVDCGGWFHCTDCCGPCPTCGGDYSRRQDRKMTLVGPPDRMSRTKARSLLHKVMAEFK